MDISSATLVQLIKDIGFPVVVALWFMFRTDRKIDKLTDVIATLTNEVIKLNKALEHRTLRSTDLSRGENGSDST